jgi:hypothetical protein
VRAVALAGIVVAVALVVAGCGSGGKSSRSSATPRPVGGQQPEVDQGAFAKLRACLKKQGVTFPPGRPQSQPSQGQRPTLDSKTQQALQACSQYLPSQPQGGFGG